MELPKKPIAEGRVAEIYAWEDGRVLKLRRDWVPDSWLEYEFKIARIVHATGLRVPVPFELIRVEDRRAIVYERVDGPTMLAQIQAAPQRARAFGRLLGHLHAEMHAKDGHPDLPENAERIERKIRSVEGAPSELKEAALARLESLAETDQHALLHGDFHPDNIIQSADGPVIIDWPDASRGHPLGDVARTVVLARMGGLPANALLRLLVEVLRKQLIGAYLRAYFKASNLDRADLDGWIFPVLFGRLSENIESERSRSIEWLYKLYET